MTGAVGPWLVLADWSGGNDHAAWRLWMDGLPGEVLEQDDLRWPRRGDWLTRLDAALRDAPQPPLLVALGLGCALVQAWAAHSGQRGAVGAALLLAPTDLTGAALTPQLRSWRALPCAALPFPALVTAPAQEAGVARDFAHACGARWRPLEPELAVGAALSRCRDELLDALAPWPPDR